MSHQINDQIMEDRYYARISWLEEKGYKDSDVMVDDGREYIIVESEAEDMGRTMKREYLPKALTLDGIRNLYE